jgi:hypothetical protein
MTRNPSSQQTSTREIVEFRSSSAEPLTPQSDGLPFGVFADLRRTLYANFGVGSSPRAVLNPWGRAGAVRAVPRMLPPCPAGSQPAFGLSAGFPCAADSHLPACNHGARGNHQRSLDGLLPRAGGHLPATDREART